MRPVTQKDIAKKLGLVDSTVSLALRDSKRVKKATRALVQKTAKRMGYRLNATASNLSKFRSNALSRPVTSALAWLNNWKNPAALYERKEYTLYWEGAKDTATRLGYNLEEFVVGEKLSWSRLGSIMQSRGITGILIPPHPHEIEFQKLAWEHYAIVRFGRSVPYPAANMVSADQLGNMLSMYEEVLKRGYKRIGMVNVSQDRSVWTNFDSGYLKAQEAHTPHAPIPIFYATLDDPLLCLPAFKKWMDREQPDAIISATAGVSKLLKATGYRIGFDIGLAATSILDTAIDAGINQHSYEVGRVAVRNLIAQVQDSDFGIPEIKQQTFITGEWVNGKTLPDRTSNE